MKVLNGTEDEREGTTMDLEDACSYIRFAKPYSRDEKVTALTDACYLDLGKLGASDCWIIGSQVASASPELDFGSPHFNVSSPVMP